MGLKFAFHSSGEGKYVALVTNQRTSPGGALNFILGRHIWCKAAKWGSKELIFYERSKELTIFNILRAYELKFEPN